MRSHTQHFHHPRLAARRFRTSAAAATTLTMALVLALGTMPASHAIATAVDMGTAGTYSVLGGQTVTNTGESVLSANLGVHPGSAITGFPPGTLGGAVHAGDAHSLQAQRDLTIAYDAAAAQATDTLLEPPTPGAPVELGGRTLVPGVYTVASAAQLTGPLTLDAGGDPNAVFVFQVGSALTTASSSTVDLVNGASPCNVYWQIGSSAVLGPSTAFVGTVMALTSISLQNGATLDGRALARNGSVTLDNNVIGTDPCFAPADDEEPGDGEGPGDGPDDGGEPAPTPGIGGDGPDAGPGPGPGAGAGPTAVDVPRGPGYPGGPGYPSGNLPDVGTAVSGVPIALAALATLLGAALLRRGRRQLSL